MGMAAGQARLLSITARLTDNENLGQDLSFSKQRLADETEQVNAAYVAALDATKLTVLTGFNGSEPNYTDISYGLLTEFNQVACGKQYVVTNQKGQILVTQAQADAFNQGNGDFNIFLAELGYTQADLNINERTPDKNDEKAEALQKIHDAWDKYLTSVGASYYDPEHGLDFGWRTTGNGRYLEGYATYSVDESEQPINYEGTTKEQRELYDYAIAITSEYYCEDSYNDTILKRPSDVEAGYIKYLKNIFDQMASFGFYTEKNEYDTIKNTTTYKGVAKSTSWFEQQLKEGKLLLKAFSTAKNDFVAVTISDDDAIQEVEDEREIALVEAKYTQDIAALERKDKKIDLELKKLDTEHNALQTEYDAVKGVIDKNVEKSFNIFS